MTFESVLLCAALGAVGIGGTVLALALRDAPERPNDREDEKEDTENLP